MSSKKKTMPDGLYKILRFFFIYYALLLSVICLVLFIAGIKTNCYLLSVFSILLIYIAPPLTHRLMSSLYPIRQGATVVDPNKYNPWINSFRLQKIYMVAPWLESLLFLVPGLYNHWLRLWGSKVGKHVYILPGVEIVDRGNVEIGDNVFIGNKTYISPHVAQQKNDKMFVYVKNVKIGANSFIGAFSMLGPGTNVPENSKVSGGSVYTFNKNEPDQKRMG